MDLSQPLMWAHSHFLLDNCLLTLQEVSGLRHEAKDLEKRLAVAERKHLQRVQRKSQDSQVGVLCLHACNSA